MPLSIRQAKRELIFSKIALMGASGSGKTYSALRLATGMAEALKPILGRDPKIIMLNSESSRGLYYANEFRYDISDVEAPHEPEKYVNAIGECVEAGYDILILDTSSKEWEGKGGCLELQQNAGGTYQAWKFVTPRHDKFITAIAESPIHIIATMRGKDQYEMEKENDKITVRKLGVGAKQRDGFEYEFTATFLIDQLDNHATTQKDNTHLFEKEGRILLSEEHGKKIIAWANSGEGYTPKPYKNVVTPEDAFTAIKKQLVATIQEKGGKNPEVIELFKSVGVPLTPKGVNSIASIEDATALLKKLEAVEKEIK